MKPLKWMMHAFMMAAFGVLFVASPSYAQSDVEYCLVNRVSTDVYFRYQDLNVQPTRLKGNWKAMRLPPNTKQCCRDCSADGQVYFDYDPPDPGKEALQHVLSLAKKLVKGAPSGASLQSNWEKNLCQVTGLNIGNVIEIFETNDGVRCDIISGYDIYRFSFDDRGRTSAPYVGIEFCNESSSEDVYAAVAYFASKADKWHSKGWWKVPKTGCTTVTLERGYRGDAYYYATRGDNHFVGEAGFCYDSDDVFEYADALGSCPSGETVGFMKTTLREGQTKTLRLPQ